jgi:hypothetical protein
MSGSSGGFGGGGGGGHNGGGVLPGSGGGYGVDHFNPVFDQLEEGSVLEDWIPRDSAGLDLLYRRIYLRDPTIGPGIDIIRGLPWSEFTLTAINDKAILRIYQECMDALNVPLLMPDLTFEFLVLGRNISSLIFDQRRGIFSGVVPHDPDFIKITPIPVYGCDPKCDFTLSPGFKKFLQSPDPRDQDARRSLPPAFLEAASKQHGFLPLDPVSTIYLARKAAPTDSIGTSLLTRTLYFWAIEKALLNAQLTSTRRRARSFVHLKAGIDQLWEPTPEEIDALSGLVIQASEDPVGGVIATRTGVEISEPVGGGADFYKWSDELELFAKYKMQCIGISDALLSGDACMVGSTLIPTEKGLFKIGELGNSQGPLWQDLNLKVGSRYGQEKVVKWLNNGIKPTFKVETQQGNSVQCTANHPLLVFNSQTGETEWKRTDLLQPGDLLCISSKPLYSTDKLPLTLSDWEKPAGPRGHSKEVLKPSQMTPELAFLLGVLVAEGSVYKNQIRISNTDEALLNRCEAAFLSVFGLEAQRYVNFDPETETRPWSKKKAWDLVVSSNVLVHYLQQLGLVTTSLDERSTSHHKEVPWSVLQADVECWKAYLAGHIEGDGSWAERLVVISFSEKIIAQLSAMLNALGYLPKIYPTRIEMPRWEAGQLYQQIRTYLISKKPSPFEGEDKARNRQGIPLDYWQNLLESKKISSSNQGMRFQTEAGIAAVAGMQIISNEKRMLYDRYAKGCYTQFLSGLLAIDPEAHRKLVQLLECRYLFTEVVSITPAGEAPVFDLSVQPGREPAFVAGGLIVHNTYNNAEQARSVFVENLATMRAKITYKFFMKSLFPTIARVHGFVKRSQAELNHRIRTTPTPSFRTGESPEEALTQLFTGYREQLPVWARTSMITSERLTQRKILQVPIGDLQIPSIEWAKQLKPNQDEKALEVLEKLQQNDYPVTLAQWATASGHNPKNIETEQKDDIDLRARIEKLKEAMGGGAEQETEEEGRVEAPESTDEIPTGEEEAVEQSLYKQAEAIGRAPMVSDMGKIAIWRNNKCGPLTRNEARQTLQSLLKEHKPEIFDDTTALLAMMQNRLGTEKAAVMSYVLNRMGLAKLPVSPKSAQVIVASARDSLNRYSSFQSSKALLDVRRYEAEVQCLMRYTKTTPKVTRSSLKVSPPQPIDKSHAFSGVTDPDMKL